MRKIATLLAALMVSATAAYSQSTFKASQDEKPCDKWIQKNFAKGQIPPFSFTYDGVPSSNFIKKWKFSKTEPSILEDGATQTLYKWTDKVTGLQVEAQVKTFSDFDAMEWTLHFRNTGDSDSKQITDINACDLKVTSTAKDGKWQLFHARGSEAGKDDFMALTKDYSVGDSLTMTPLLGRSSSRAFPYFNIKTPQGGMVFAIGWSGNWRATIKRPTADAFAVETALRDLDAYIRPGEEFRTNLTAMIPWQGEDRMDGQNILRRFIMKHHYPTHDGKIVEPPICSSFNYGDPYPCNEYTCMTGEYGVALIHRYEQFGILPEVFWLDAGWYEKADDWKNGWNWANAVGNWVPDSTRFPQGLGQIADAAHEVGCKFLVWFEPERVVKDSYWAYEHPEYMLLAGGGKPVPHEIDRKTQDSFLIDMGNPQARQWLTESIIKLMKDNRIDYYRQDYNVDPEWFWLSNDEPGRKGLCENRYICGLYAYWDALREAFPGLLIDNCASGGRRLDLEATSRSMPLWRTDYNYSEPNGYQSHTYGLSQWLPASGTGLISPEPFAARSSYNAALTFNWSITSASSNILEMQKRIAEIQSIRHYYLDDFYPLTGYGDTTPQNIWIAYQLNRESDCTGRILAFRRDECPVESITVHLRGLVDGKTYVVENQDSFDRFEMTGKELADGLVLTLKEAKSSMFLKYWEKQ